MPRSRISRFARVRRPAVTLSRPKTNFPQVHSAFCFALEGIKKIVSDMHPEDTVEGLESLEVRERPIVFRLLPKGKAVDVVDMLDAAVQGDLVESLTDEQAVEFLGELTADDAMDVLEHEATSDMYDTAGLISIQTTESDRSYSMINGSLRHVIAVRVPFLLVTLVGGMLAGVVIGAWEETLEAVVATALFIPVIMDMGGNVGTQSSTIFTRGLVLGQIPTKRFMRFWLRETWNGHAAHTAFQHHFVAYRNIFVYRSKFVLYTPPFMC